MKYHSLSGGTLAALLFTSPLAHAQVKLAWKDNSKTETNFFLERTIRTGTGPIYYRIKNRWKGTYVYDAGTMAKYGPSPSATNILYQWQLVSTDSGYVNIKNRSTGDVLHIENLTGNLQCTANGNGWYSSQWTPQNTDSGYARYSNRWQGGNYFHVENQTGTVQYGVPSNPDWLSNQWALEAVADTTGPWTNIATLPANTTSYTDNNCGGGVTYYYRVKAANSTWTSKYTNLASRTIAAPVAGLGTGLKGQYYKDNALASLIKTQTDAQVNFDWGTGSPGTSIGADNFSIRWSGNVLTQEGGTYSFSTETDDGVRLWINNVLVIDKWTTLGTFAAPITLAANTKYTVKMEYKELTGGAFARLKWLKPGQTSAALIPKAQLFPA